MYLRTVYLFVTVHMFCAHLDGPKSPGFVSGYLVKQSILRRFITTQEKQSWKQLLESEKNMRDNHAFIRDD